MTHAAVLSAALLLLTACDTPDVVGGEPAPVLAPSGPSLPSAGEPPPPAPDDVPEAWEPVRYRFTLLPGMPTPPAADRSWSLRPPDDLSAAAATLAAVLSLPQPAPSALSEDLLRSEGEDGSELDLDVSGDWVYSGPDVCFTPPDATDPDPGCGPPMSDDDAVTSASELFSDLGLAGSSWRVSGRDDWGVWVEADLLLPGSALPSGLTLQAGFWADGTLSYASGTFAVPVPGPDLPVVSVAEAAARIESEMNALLEGAEGEFRVQEVVLTGFELVTLPEWHEGPSWRLTPHFLFSDSEGDPWYVPAHR